MIGNVDPRYEDRVLSILRQNGMMSGRDLRRALNRSQPWWRQWSDVGFYRLMAQLEDCGVVLAWWAPDDSGLFRVRTYAATPIVTAE